MKQFKLENMVTRKQALLIDDTSGFWFEVIRGSLGARRATFLGTRQRTVRRFLVRGNWYVLRNSVEAIDIMRR